jgi:hypothetical protein
MTFLESPATLTSVSVQGDRTAPLLRLVDSPFNITGAAFIGGSTPSISAEYSSGALTETLIAEGGGLRAIGSIVRLERSRFERIPEIAVQVGHESTLSGAEVAVRAAGTAFACESGSTITGDGISVRDTGVGVQTDRVGAGFEAGTVTLNHPNFSNVTTPYVQDGGGTIVVDSRRVNP